MLVRSGSARNETIDLRLAGVLSGVAGALNASAFYAAGFFSANMTGNVSLLSDGLALGRFGEAGFFLLLVTVFIAGSFTATRIISGGLRRGNTRIYAVTILIEAFLLALLGGTVLLAPLPWNTRLMVMGLAFILGLQNAVGTRISDARLRTTHVSGIVTDIGIELGLLTREDGKDQRAVTIAKLRLHLCTLLSFLGGGVIGLVFYRGVGAGVLFCAAFFLLILATPAFRRDRYVK